MKTKPGMSWSLVGGGAVLVLALVSENFAAGAESREGGRSRGSGGAASGRYGEAESHPGGGRVQSPGLGAPGAGAGARGAGLAPGAGVGAGAGTKGTGGFLGPGWVPAPVTMARAWELGRPVQALLRAQVWERAPGHAVRESLPVRELAPLVPVRCHMVITQRFPQGGLRLIMAAIGVPT